VVSVSIRRLEKGRLTIHVRSDVLGSSSNRSPLHRVSHRYAYPPNEDGHGKGQDRMAELQGFDRSHGHLSISVSAQPPATFLSNCVLGVHLVRRRRTVRCHREIHVAPV
jgi:hypothetical protein